MRKPLPYKKAEENKPKIKIEPKKIIIVVVAAIISIALCILFTVVFSIIFKISPYISAIISGIVLVVLSAFIVKQFISK